MGAVILQAADERIMHSNSIMMLHDGSTALEGSARDVENWSEYLKRQRQLSYKILASRTKHTAKYWERKCATDYILTAEKALAEGLIDKICGWQD
jgi:ATP-dependent Clp protease protease subunit